MRKLFIVLFFVVCASLYAQFPSSFAGATFGESVEMNVSQLRKSGHNLEFGRDTIGYSANIAGRGYIIILSVVDEKVNGAVAIHRPSYGAWFTSYIRILNELKEVYGEGTGNIVFLAPYERGDGFEDQAISRGRTRIAHQWRFENQSIGILCTRQGETVLFYTYNVMVEEEKIKAEKSIALSEY